MEGRTVTTVKRPLAWLMDPLWSFIWWVLQNSCILCFKLASGGSMKTFRALMRYIVKNTTSCKTPLTDLMGIPGIVVSASKQISHSKSLKSYRLSWTNPIPHCIAVKLEKKFYLACSPIKKKERERERKNPFRTSALCQRKFNIQKKPILCGFLRQRTKSRATSESWSRSLSIFMCWGGDKKKKRENKFGGGGGGGGREGEMGVFIEWCESLCNDRSLMKSSSGVLIHSAVSPCATVQCIPALEASPRGKPTQWHDDIRRAGAEYHLKREKKIKSEKVTSHSQKKI